MTSEKIFIANAVIPEILPKNWQTTDESVSADDVIDAYFKGKEDGAKEHFEKVRQEFMVNLKLASSIAEELYATAKDAKILIDEIHLKPSAYNCFDILFLVNEETYDSDEFLEAYSLSRAMKQKYRSNRINLTFSFTSNSEDLSKSCLAADGYMVRYGQTKKA